jgi:hypothetical protein
LKKASRFFVAGGRLWYREQDGRHRVVVFEEDRRGIWVKPMTILVIKVFTRPGDA